MKIITNLKKNNHLRVEKDVVLIESARLSPRLYVYNLRHCSGDGREGAALVWLRTDISPVASLVVDFGWHSGAQDGW